MADTPEVPLPEPSGHVLIGGALPYTAAQMTAYGDARAAAAVAPLIERLEAAEADARRFRWLRDLQCNSVSVSRDDHASNYCTAAEWIEKYAPEHFADDDPEDVQRMKDANTIWCVQIYPRTPVSFDWVHAATLDAAIDHAIAGADTNQKE